MPLSSSTVDNTLIVHALDAELKKQLGGYNVVTTGVGKVNAVYSLMSSLAEYKEKHGTKPVLVLNVGSAGSTKFVKGTVVNCTKFIQRDMEAMALKCNPFETPFDEVPSTLENGLRFETYPEGICGTGDSFVTGGADGGEWNVVDMEAYALAKICYKEQIPFCCLKYISDGADNKAAETWEDELSASADALMKIIKNVVKRV